MAAAFAPAPAEALELQLERHRRGLTAYCYRMLGSGLEAEDAVQETLVRAWRAIGGLEQRSALRPWLYQIASNVCLDMLQAPQRRAQPMDLGGQDLLPAEGDPAELATARDTIRLAFLAALQHLPPRQRAVLILHEVLSWRASEVADLLGTTVAAVNSALQRARATLHERDTGGARPADSEQRELVARYADAFAAYDVSRLVALLGSAV